MADYRLTQSGDQVQEILNNAAMQSDLTAEQERAELAEQTLQNNIDAEALAREQADGVLDGKIDANTTRIVNIEGKIPSGASTENKLTTESEMNSAIATATATFRGTYNLVSDLGLAVSATHEQIATALAGEIATADNNDYCFVQVPTSESTPTQIAKIERYKFNGTAWAFEYELNNSGFTAEQWAAINSGITASQVAALPGMSQAIEAILVLIPSAASALNQLADKAFVNSSVSTNTATFRGTFNMITDLNLSLDATRAQIAAALLVAAPTADNNDYAFVQIPTSAQTPTEISATERYKFNGTAWAYEYSLNTSGFTAQQWNAINSGITSALVTLLGQIIPSAATASNQLADKAYVLAQILAAIPSFKGQFTTLADLQAVASPKSGDIGIVRTTDSDGFATFTFYQYLNNQWNVYYTLAHHLQNKPATTGTSGDYPYNGMGRVVIPKNMVDIAEEGEPENIVNLLTQAAFEDSDSNPLTNTIFVIQYDFELAEDITIPVNCVLEFEGGSISGAYTITFADTKIVANKEVFDISGVAGTIANKEVYLSWWKLAYDSNTNDAILINQIIAAVDNCVFYYDIQNDIYVGGTLSDISPSPASVSGDYSIRVEGKNYIDIKQTTPYFTILKGISKGGQVFLISGNNHIRVSGVRIDGNNIHAMTTGENGFGIVGNTSEADKSFVDLSDCIVKNCQKGFDAIEVYGDIYHGGTYPEWGSGGKGIQIEDGSMKAFVHNCCVYDSYAGISNNQSNNSSVTYDHIYIKGCNIGIISIRVSGVSAQVSTFTNITLDNCTGENGLICMSNVSGIVMNGIDVRGGTIASSLIRGSYNTCMIDVVCTQQVTRIFDIALFRDNPQGDAAAFSIVNVVCPTSTYIFGDSILQYPVIGKAANAKFQNGQYIVSYLTGATTDTNTLSNLLLSSPQVKLIGNGVYFEGGFTQLLSGNNKIPNDKIRWGTTANRPSNPEYGCIYFDITLSPERPIWYYSGHWVDATGATV